MNSKPLEKTVERIVPDTFESREAYLLYLRHVFAYEQFIRQTRDDIDVLELGFGEGYGTSMISKHCGEITALDVNPPSVEYANETYGSQKCRFMHFDGHTIPFEDAAFDAVVSMQVIEHIEDDHAFLDELQRVLKPGGEAHLTTPNRETRLAPDQEPWNPFHVREYTAEELDTLLLSHFDQVTVSGVRAEPAVEAIEAKRVKRGLSAYKLLPDFLKRLVTGDYQSAYGTESFFLSDDHPRKGMDLYAVGTKVI